MTTTKAPPLRIIKGGVVPVPDGEYLPVAREMIAKARHWCLCSLFIVDIVPQKGDEPLVDQLLKALTGAAWRGVDTRIAIGGSRTSLDIMEVSAVAVARVSQLGIPVKWIIKESKKSNHSKVVIADNQVLIGSHNWTGGAFAKATQDSVLCQSPELAAALSLSFNEAWSYHEK